MENSLKELISRNISAHYDYLMAQEKTLTQQEILIANEKVLTQVLKSEEELLQMLYKKYFHEREQLYQYANETLKSACKNRNVELARAATDMIKVINQKNMLGKGGK